jgi:hypothetical protein
MLERNELLAWARIEAKRAAGADTGLLLGATWGFVTAAIAAAYLRGGIDALADEIERKRNGVTLKGASSAIDEVAFGAAFKELLSVDATWENALRAALHVYLSRGGR